TAVRRPPPTGDAPPIHQQTTHSPPHHLYHLTTPQLWELVTVLPLFPGVKGKQNITQHVLAGNRPEIYDEWPKSLKTLLALCWHEDANRRPLFREIQDKFDRVIIDVMCPDPT